MPLRTDTFRILFYKPILSIFVIRFLWQHAMLPPTPTDLCFVQALLSHLLEPKNAEDLYIKTKSHPI